MAADVGLPAGFVLDQAAPAAPQGLPPGFQLDQAPATPDVTPASVDPPGPPTESPGRPQPLGRIDRSNEIEGVYTDAQGRQRIVNPTTDMVGDDGMVYPRQTGLPGEVTSRGTILPFVETRGPDGRPQQGLGLPEIIAGPVDRANRLLTEPAAPGTGQNESAIFDALQAAQMGMGSVRTTATREFTNEARALANQVGPQRPPPGSAPFVGPVRPTVQPAPAIGDLAAQAGVDLPRAAAGGAGTRAVAGTLREIPLVGTPLVKAANRATEQMQQGVERVADALGPSSRVGAGQAARDSIVDWIERRSAADLDAAYRSIDSLIAPATEVPLSRTQQAVARLAARDVDSATRDGQAAINLVREAVGRSGMTYDGIKGLRTSIGERLSGDIDEHGVSNRALQSLYSALSEDLRFAVRRSGTAKRGSSGRRALAAFDEANNAAKTVFEQRAALTKIIGRQADAPGEAVADRILAMAGAKRGADIERVNLARRVMTPDAWDDLAGSVVRQMGRDKDGWSLAKWRTEYTRLSPEGRTAMFGSGKGSHREALETIAEVAKYAEWLQKTGNPSQSGRFATIVAAPTAAFANLPATIFSAVGGRLAAHWLARPVTAQATAQAMKAARALQRQPSSLGRHQALVAAVKALSVSLGEDPTEAESRLQKSLPAPTPRRPTETDAVAPPAAPPQPLNAMAGLRSENAMVAQGQPGSSEDNPIPARTRAEVERLPPGTYVVDPRGRVSRRN